MINHLKEKKGEIVIFKAKGGKAALDVRLQEDTVWLSQIQMARLFQKGIPNINEHIRTILRQKELEAEATIRKFRIVRKEGKRLVERDIDHYNLDMIISVGYRVNSKRGIQFRIWATNVLRDHLVKGYTLYQKRLQENLPRLKELEDAVEIVRSAQEGKQLSAREASGLLSVITDYTRSWLLLQRYDEDKLPVKELNREVSYEITEEEAWKAIESLKNDLRRKKEAGDLFGQESTPGNLKGILGNINQTFGGYDLYSSVEEKAAHLLYFIIKDHPFIDGNKRIGSLLFIWFLDRNKSLYGTKGERKINDNALVALALLVAESNPKHKELMIKLIINLIAGNQ